MSIMVQNVKICRTLSERAIEVSVNIIMSEQEYVRLAVANQNRANSIVDPDTTDYKHAVEFFISALTPAEQIALLSKAIESRLSGSTS